MANIKRIELINVKKWDGSDWVPLKQKNGAGIEDIDTVMVYDNVTGFVPGQYQVSLNWANFSNKTSSGLTIFGTDTGLIVSTQKSIRIKYRIKTTSAGSPDTEVVSSNTYYQLINLAVPDSGAFSGLPANTNNSIDASIIVYMPAFNDTMVGSGLAATVQGYLANPANWRLNWTKPDLTATDLIPGTATVGTPTTSETAEYNGYRVPVTLTYRLPVISTGQYKLKIAFTPNDGDVRTVFAQESTCNATVTVNMASQNDGTIYAVDAAVAFNIVFSG